MRANPSRLPLNPVPYAAPDMRATRTSLPAVRVWMFDMRAYCLPTHITLWPRCGACMCCVVGSPPIHAPAWRCCGVWELGRWIGRLGPLALQR